MSWDRGSKGHTHPIVRNPAALKETLMLGFIAKARIWQPQSVSCLLPVLLICPNKRSLLDAGVIGGHPFLSQPNPFFFLVVYCLQLAR